MQKSCREIIEQAKRLSQTQNSKAFDFSFIVSILNSVYAQLYNDLSAYSNGFIKYFEFTGNEADLPDDCYKVDSVFYGDIDSPYIINQSSINNFIPGTYYIENNVIKIIDKKDSKKITVKYSTIPLVLTCPDDPIDITSVFDTYSGLENIILDDDGFYFTYNGQAMYYNFEKEEAEEVTGLPARSITFNNKSLIFDSVNQTVTWNGEDVTDYFAAKDLQTGEDLEIESMVWDNTHIAIQYNNWDLYVMTTNWNKVLVNPYLYKGRYFKSSFLYDICGNDFTGKGMIAEDGISGKILYMDFVPDTVLDYPNSVFFDLIEDRVAIQLQSLAGLTNDALQSKADKDEMSFYSSLQRSNQGNRIRNDSNYRRGWF